MSSQSAPALIIAEPLFSPQIWSVRFLQWWCNVEAEMVAEGAALEPLPWEAQGLDGLELPRTIQRHGLGDGLGLTKSLKKWLMSSVKNFVRSC